MKTTIKTKIYKRDDLYLCPRCGHRPDIRAKINDTDGMMRVSCAYCGSQGYDYAFSDVDSLVKSTLDSVVNDWNHQPMWRN